MMHNLFVEPAKQTDMPMENHKPKMYAKTYSEGNCIAKLEFSYTPCTLLK